MIKGKFISKAVSHLVNSLTVIGKSWKKNLFNERMNLITKLAAYNHNELQHCNYILSFTPRFSLHYYFRSLFLGIVNSK